MQFIDETGNTHPTQYGKLLRARRGIVIHASAGVDSLAWLQRYEPRPAKRSSADYLIDKIGNVRLIVPWGHYSYHSGAARWRGYQETDGTINRGFVGIELENEEDGKDKISDQQYIACAAMVRYHMTHDLIHPRDICLHWECAIPEGRKSDPIRWDWTIFTRELINPSGEAAGLLDGVR